MASVCGLESWVAGWMLQNFAASGLRAFCSSTQGSGIPQPKGLLIVAVCGTQAFLRPD
ncbi:hypothetical protein OZX67_09370 [Bifidobacterium sp. ESL0728]|uniref:hypothetical protein n=1 Tax=Bifidobacterium sp. ESL0728 TaxID=2983220 RepID=UPI0023F78B01|nr:hypothetical protein [Bifidobacterium sp. ESL0728]WEV58976.1 hypothetical protein OZX67_09370 [Bifidobacterium sp. ESL0728]